MSMKLEKRKPTPAVAARVARKRNILATRVPVLSVVEIVVVFILAFTTRQKEPLFQESGLVVGRGGRTLDG